MSLDKVKIARLNNQQAIIGGSFSQTLSHAANPINTEILNTEIANTSTNSAKTAADNGTTIIILTLNI